MQETQRAHTATHTAGVYYVSERVKMLIKCVKVKQTAMCDSKMSKTSCFVSCFLVLSGINSKTPDCNIHSFKAPSQIRELVPT